MKRVFKGMVLAMCLGVAPALCADTPEYEGNVATQATDSMAASLDEVAVTVRRRPTLKSVSAINTDLISRAELMRAACCNLGESFSTNPSVDVNYSDAATGARQIRLLGLSGSYVLMLTENVPNFRGAAAPYSLGYIPGPWMDGISVSKGAASVKNGYESITGQINVGYRKPQSEPSVNGNLYLDSHLRLEANADANFHLGNAWSTGLLAHYEHQFMGHDANDDGFLDRPRVSQLNVMNRWSCFTDNYIFQGGVKFLTEERRGGQDGLHAGHDASGMPLYTIGVGTHRYEAFAKNAYIFDHEHNTNLALILSGTLHDQDSRYGYRKYDVMQTGVYASLMFESQPTEIHTVSAGLSFNLDHLSQHYRLTQADLMPLSRRNIGESVGGAYAEYTLTPSPSLTLLVGLRADYSSLHGWIVTPRAHVKWTPATQFTLRISGGRGTRTVFALAEYNYLLASSRKFDINVDDMRESAWNSGIGATWFTSIASRTLNISAEYYYTHFTQRMVVDMDTDPHAVVFNPLHGRAFSHTLQVEASYPIIEGLIATAAFRLNDVKTTIGDRLRSQPLTSRFKWLLTASYVTPLELWQADVTLQVNGHGRMPDPYTLPDGSPSWSSTFPTYCQLSAQVTRHFRHFSIYAGGENLTDFTQKNPIIGANDPWGPRFDATMVWGPVDGAMVYAGVRLNFNLH